MAVDGGDHVGKIISGNGKKMEGKSKNKELA